MRVKWKSSTENSCFFELQRKFWPSGSISAIPEGSKKSLFKGSKWVRDIGTKVSLNQLGIILRSRRHFLNFHSQNETPRDPRGLPEPPKMVKNDIIWGQKLKAQFRFRVRGSLRFHLGVSVDPSFEAPGRLQPPFWDHFGTQNRILLDEKTISAKTSIFTLLGNQFLQKK